MLERIVAAIDGQRVLGQVVGADGDEVEVADQRRQRDRGGRHLDHRAEFEVIGDLVAARAQLARALG